MSATREQKVLDCHRCGQPTPEGQHIEDGDGWYCSTECRFIHRGSKVLNQIETDHTICASCFKKLKSIEKPPDGTNLNIGAPEIGNQEFLAKDCLVGFQYPTEHTEWGIDDNGKEAGERVHFTRWMCSCGVVDPNTRDEFVTETDLENVVDRLVDRLEELNAKDAIGGDFSEERFRDAFDAEETNFEYAIGFSCFG